MEKSILSILRTTVISLAIITLFVFSSKGTAQEVIDSICAIVGDEIILESDVVYGVHTYLLESGERFPAEELLTELRGKVLEAYITQKILIAKAFEDTLNVENRIVNKELERKLEGLIAQIGSKEKLEEYFGRPLRQIKREMRQGVRDGLLMEMTKNRQVAGIQIRRQEVIDFYHDRSEDMPKLPERVILSHILLEVNTSEEAQQQAEDRAARIHDIMKSGADFDSVAIEYSEDPSASDGGRLGFTERNDLVTEYEEVAFQLQPGEISGIVGSRYGLHIIKLLERQGEKISTQHILIRLSPNEADWERILSQAVELRRRIDDGENFAELAVQYSVDSETAPDGGLLEQIATQDLPQEFQNMIETIAEGEVAEPFETTFGVHLIKLNERLPVRTISLSEDWQNIEQFALFEKRERKFQDWIASLKKDLYIWPTQTD
ncbi:peptidylprolyl isomerase [bacterium]|nr:peptidylprolyl isomerase [bacterium]